jgi:hypothetical protein
MLPDLRSRFLASIPTLIALLSQFENRIRYRRRSVVRSLASKVYRELLIPNPKTSASANDLFHNKSSG